MHGEGAQSAQQIAELHRRLGLAPPHPIGRVTQIAVTTEAGATAAIVLRPRSLYELFASAAASVEVPAEHLASGIAPTLPEPLNATAGIHIHSSEAAPDRAMTAIEHNGFWYWIDVSDTASKLTFRLLSSLMSVRMGDDAKAARPTLTVPVSR